MRRFRTRIETYLGYTAAGPPQQSHRAIQSMPHQTGVRRLAEDLGEGAMKMVRRQACRRSRLLELRRSADVRKQEITAAQHASIDLLARGRAHCRHAGDRCRGVLMLPYE